MCAYVFMYSTRYFDIFNETSVFSADFEEKHSNIKFNEKPPSWSRVFFHADGQT